MYILRFILCAVKFYSVQFSSATQSCPTLCYPMDCSMPGFPVHHQCLLKLTSIESKITSNQLILCRLLLLLPSIFPSTRVFYNESALHIRWPKYWNFSFSINPSNEYSGLITFRIDWFDLLADQGTLNRLLQHHSSKASIFGTLPSLWSKCISKLLTFISVSGSCPFHRIVSSSCLRKQKTNKT